MRNELIAACVLLACALFGARDARADLLAFPLGVPALTSATREIDLAHYVYFPVIGSWIAVGHPGGASGALVFDGLCQDLVDFAFLVAVGDAADRQRSSIWRVLPWFPQSGGGGVSLRATF